MAQSTSKGRGSTKRETTRGKNGYYGRQTARSNQNILRRLDRHLKRHPKDGVAKAARSDRAMNPHFSGRAR